MSNLYSNVSDTPVYSRGYSARSVRSVPASDQPVNVPIKSTFLKWKIIIPIVIGVVVVAAGAALAGIMLTNDDGESGNTDTSEGTSGSTRTTVEPSVAIPTTTVAFESDLTTSDTDMPTAVTNAATTTQVNTEMSTIAATTTQVDTGMSSTPATTTQVDTGISTSAATTTQVDTGMSTAVKTTTQMTESTTKMTSSSKIDMTDETTLSFKDSTSATATTLSTATPTGVAYTIGIWNDWGDWTSCDVTCGEGTHTRYRTCNETNTVNNPCVGESVQVGLCQSTSCPVYGLLTTWATWGSCDVTCGGGIQTRTRTCTKVDESNIDCVGNTSMTQACNQWNCPDCSQSCTIGTLNAACDRCECLTTSTTITVKSTKSIPINDATISAASSPNTLLTTTNEAGVAVLESTCTETDIIVNKETYQSVTVTVTTSTLTVTLEMIEYPHFEAEPVSKARLVGESVTFCCSAKASPSVDYYEWFFGTELLPSSQYPNGTHLYLPDVQVSDSGAYKCRANTPTGSAFSTVSQLIVQQTSEEFCTDALIQNTVSLPSDCVQAATNTTLFDIGACSTKLCRKTGSAENSVCGNGNYSVCQAKNTVLTKVQCDSYELEFIVINSCGCELYTEPTLTVSGTASGLNTGTPLSYGTVQLDGVFYGYTTASGYFTVTVTVSKSSITLNFIDDYYKEYLDMTKTIFLYSESIEIDVTMIPAAEPIVFDSTSENTIYTNTNASDSNSVGEIVIPADSYYSTDGSVYNGKVQVSLTFIDPTNQSNTDIFPGVFEFTNEEGEVSGLESLGVFNLKVSDENNNDLYISNPVSLTINEANENASTSPMYLWGMSEVNGNWELISTGTDTGTRRRRSFRYVVFDPNQFSWRNIDSLSRRTYCYFKAKVYQTSTLTTEVSMPIISRAFFLAGGRATLDKPSYQYTNRNTCFKTICNDVDGFIEIYTSHSLNSDSSILPSQPVNPADYSVTDNGRLINIRLKIDDTNGPFYSSNSRCQASGDTKLKYYKQTADENIYTFKYVLGSTSTFPSPQTFVTADEKVWFYNHGSTNNGATRACHLKVAISQLPSYLTPTVRIMSKVGTFTSLSSNIGDVLGIREAEYDNGACVEYRCSNDKDTTHVTVSLVYKKYSQSTCTISSVSQNLVSASATTTDSVGQETFLLLMPRQVLEGTYDHDTTGYTSNSGTEVEKLARTKQALDGSKTRCEAGTSVGVTFTC